MYTIRDKAGQLKIRLCTMSMIYVRVTMYVFVYVMWITNPNKHGWTHEEGQVAYWADLYLF